MSDGLPPLREVIAEIPESCYRRSIARGLWLVGRALDGRPFAALARAGMGLPGLSFWALCAR